MCIRRIIKKIITYIYMYITILLIWTWSTGTTKSFFIRNNYWLTFSHDFQAKPAFNCDRWPDTCLRGISSPGWLFAYSIAHSICAIRRIRSTHRNQIVVTSCWATCHYWPIPHSLSSPKNWDSIRWEPVTRTSKS